MTTLTSLALMLFCLLASACGEGLFGDSPRHAFVAIDPGANPEWRKRAEQLEDENIAKSKLNYEEQNASLEDHNLHTPLIIYGHDSVAIRVGQAMSPGHFIVTVYVKDQNGTVFALREFTPSEPLAFVEFDLKAEATKVRAFAYCNVHGLWTDSLERP